MLTLSNVDRQSPPEWRTRTVAAASQASQAAQQPTVSAAGANKNKHVTGIPWQHQHRHQGRRLQFCLPFCSGGTSSQPHRHPSPATAIRRRCMCRYIFCFVGSFLLFVGMLFTAYVYIVDDSGYAGVGFTPEDIAAAAATANRHADECDSQRISSKIKQKSRWSAVSPTSSPSPLNMNNITRFNPASFTPVESRQLIRDAMVKAAMAAGIMSTDALDATERTREWEYCEVRNHTADSVRMEALHRPPTVPIDTTCGPAPLPDPALMCKEEYGGVGLRRRRDGHRMGNKSSTSSSGTDSFYSMDHDDHVPRMYDVFAYAHEIDVLEMRLWETNESVDHYFIVESRLSHTRRPETPVLEQMFRDDPRLTPFASKVTVLPYFAEAGTTTFGMGEKEKYGNTIINETELRRRHKEDEFKIEHEKDHWITQWVVNNTHPGDIILRTHLDEIPNRRVLWGIKHCGIPLPVSPVLWFPLGNAHHAFKPDFVLRDKSVGIRERDNAWGTWHVAWDYGFVPHSYYAGGCEHLRYYLRGAMTDPPYPFIVGGFHASSYGWGPAVALKKYTMSESDAPNFSSVLQSMSFYNGKGDCLRRAASGVYGRDQGHHHVLADRTASVEHLKQNEGAKDLLQLPWLLGCNPGRYPTWFGIADLLRGHD